MYLLFILVYFILVIHSSQIYVLFLLCRLIYIFLLNTLLYFENERFIYNLIRPKSRKSQDLLNILRNTIYQK